ncbi:MAG: hypothetical protein AMJ92_12150 [candidate division Zixibacteria bacterium SM23_81]|nr:MAG: hypothetical protein AMJ92_12150 [candidate division Zixibacteria bacterium SM23_81]
MMIFNEPDPGVDRAFSMSSLNHPAIEGELDALMYRKVTKRAGLRIHRRRAEGGKLNRVKMIMMNRRGKKWAQCQTRIFARIRFSIGLLSMCAVISGNSAQAKTWYVPAEVITIKAAVEDSATEGDSVLVAPGEYDTSSGEVFPIIMKNGVVLTSEEGTLSTVIDANMTERVLDCQNLDNLTVTSGFTITGGWSSNGGGIYCSESFLLIKGNVIRENAVEGGTGSGGGIYCHLGAPRIVDNHIAQNTASRFGGGIYCYYSSAVIDSNTISHNTARWGGGVFNDHSSSVIRYNFVKGNHVIQTGAGLDCYMGSSPTIMGNVVIGNIAGENGAGIACCYDCAPLIKHNTIVSNVGAFGGGVRTLGNSSPTVSANIILDNVDGVYLISDSGPVTANHNHIYCNTYQTGDYEVINTTTQSIDLSNNFWWLTDVLSIAFLIQGDCNFFPFLSSPRDSIPGEPSEVSSVAAMSDSSYALPVMRRLGIGDSLYLQLEGVDWNSSFIEPALVIITSQKDPHGIGAALIETGAATGLYRGMVTVASFSSDVNNQIGVHSNDTIIIWAHVDSTKRDTVTIEAIDVGEKNGDEEYPVPVSFHLDQNYPNPCNRATEIGYQIHVPSYVTLQIYNICGQLVRTLVQELQEEGAYTIQWDGQDAEGEKVASGIYCYRLTAGHLVDTKKLVVLR